MGNPGQEYAQTRHNIGFRVIDYLASIHQIVLRQKQSDSLIGVGKIGGKEVLLAQPMTFMNRSGVAVRSLLARAGGGPVDLVVIHDDIDMRRGKIRIKLWGGHGGHQGVASIIEALSTDRFIRIKIGIGRQRGCDPDEYVLSPFDPGDIPEIDEAIGKAARATTMVINGEVNRAMNELHRRDSI